MEEIKLSSQQSNAVDRTSTCRRDRMQDVFMYTYVRDIPNARKYYQTAADSLLRLRGILFTDSSIQFKSSFIRRLILFLPCVEVIPEHTDRAARIKQSRVKMMRLKAKIEREAIGWDEGFEGMKKKEKTKLRRISNGGG